MKVEEKEAKEGEALEPQEEAKTRQGASSMAKQYKYSTYIKLILCTAFSQVLFQSVCMGCMPCSTVRAHAHLLYVSANR